jgi:carbamoyl-phosphate synthase large subunit
VVILGGGPNRIGQGIEFDYCCVHAALAIRAAGMEAIMVNCNPETVSTDWDISDRLYFEPLTLEDVLSILEVEKPFGVIVQYGGQTPLKLARALEAAGAPIIGTSPDSIDLAEDRQRFQRLLADLGLLQPENRTVMRAEDAKIQAREVGYPLVVRPSYVLGGRGMQIIFREEELAHYFTAAVKVSNDAPVLLDRFLERAIEVDVDAICDGEDVVIGGIMEHIEQAGVHSGDSACALPPYTLSHAVQDQLREQTARMARALGVVGLMNVQFAIQEGEIYVLEVNPRASRTVPFVSKATGRSLARIAALTMVGVSLKEQGVVDLPDPAYTAVKEAVFPFVKFPGVQPLLGPEMKSTGEVMGVAKTFADAFGRAQKAANMPLPASGKVFVSVRKQDRPQAVELARSLHETGYAVVATEGTAMTILAAGIPCERVNKVSEGHYHIVDMIKNDEIGLIVNAAEGEQAVTDSHEILRAALQHRVAYTTTLVGAQATVAAMGGGGDEEVHSLQELHKSAS